MIIVDPDKLKQYREMIDTDVAEIAITRNLSIPRALLKYAADELEHILCMHNVGSSWCSCHPIPMSVVSGKREFRGEKMLQYHEKAAHHLVEVTVLSRLPELAAIAAICRLIDPKVDVAMDADDFRALYRHSDWSEIVHAMPGLERRGKMIDTDRLLFETDEEYQDRLAKTAFALKVEENAFHELLRFTGVELSEG